VIMLLVLMLLLALSSTMLLAMMLLVVVMLLASSLGALDILLASVMFLAMVLLASSLGALDILLTSVMFLAMVLLLAPSTGILGSMLVVFVLLPCLVHCLCFLALLTRVFLAGVVGFVRRLGLLNMMILFVVLLDHDGLLAGQVRMDFFLTVACTSRMADKISWCRI